MKQIKKCAAYQINVFVFFFSGGKVKDLCDSPETLWETQTLVVDVKDMHSSSLNLGSDLIEEKM